MGEKWFSAFRQVIGACWRRWSWSCCIATLVEHLPALVRLLFALPPSPFVLPVVASLPHSLSSISHKRNAAPLSVTSNTNTVATTTPPLLRSSLHPPSPRHRAASLDLLIRSTHPRCPWKRSLRTIKRLLHHPEPLPRSAGENEGCGAREGGSDRGVVQRCQNQAGEAGGRWGEADTAGRAAGGDARVRVGTEKYQAGWTLGVVDDRVGAFAALSFSSECNSPLLTQAHSLGMTPSLITVAKTAPSAKNRFLFTPPTLTMLPNSLPSLFKGLFTTPLLRRILPSAALEPFRPRSPAHDLPDGGDESVDAFFARRFGKPIAEEMASAMIHGIYSGDSRRLSVRAVFPQLWEAEREWGSVVLAGLLGGFARRRGWKNKSAWRVAKEKEDEEMEKVKSGLRASGKEGEELVGRTEGASVWGVRGGLQELTLALEERLRKEGVEFWMGEQGKVEKVEKVEGNWKVRCSFPPSSLSLSTMLTQPVLQITTSSSSLAATHLIATNPTVLASLSPPSFPSSTVSVINLAFPRPVTSSPPLFPPGFGYLIPRTVPLSQNPHHVLGIIFDSDVMPDVDSSYDKLVKITLITGGSYWLDKTKPLPKKSHDELVQGAMETLSLHFPHTTFPAPTHAFSHTHLDCIPQVPPGSLPAFKAFGERLRKAGNVAVVGGGYSAVGVNGCVKGGWEVGEAFGKAISRSLEGREGAAKEKSEEAVKTVKTGTEMWEI